jgi:pimeloyl-ACP methyl ester carboxylesterase
MVDPANRLLSTASELVDDAYAELAPFQPDRSPSSLEQQYTTEASEFLDLGDARVHYRDEGPRDAPAIVLLHGTYSSLHTWTPWVRRLSEEFRLVRLDMPGFGLTGPRRGRHTLYELVRTVGVVCDELGLQEVTVAGNSLGGGVAWRLSIERPDLVSGLLLLNAGGATLISTLSGNLMALTGPTVQRYLTPRLFVRLFLLDAYADASEVTDSRVRRYHDLMLRRGNRRAVVEIGRNYETDHLDGSVQEIGTRIPQVPSAYEPEPYVWDDYDISEVDVPALFQWGSEDTWLPESFGRELADRVPDSQFVTYEPVGHIIMEEDPDRTAADAADFLRNRVS